MAKLRIDPSHVVLQSYLPTTTLSYVHQFAYENFLTCYP